MSGDRSRLGLTVQQDPGCQRGQAGGQGPAAVKQQEQGLRWSGSSLAPPSCPGQAPAPHGWRPGSQAWRAPARPAAHRTSPRRVSLIRLLGGAVSSALTSLETACKAQPRLPQPCPRQSELPSLPPRRRVPAVLRRLAPAGEAEPSLFVSFTQSLPRGPGLPLEIGGAPQPGSSWGAGVSCWELTRQSI